MVGVLTVGSRALKCYTCEKKVSYVDPESPDLGGKECFDKSLDMDTCEAREYCGKLEYKCPQGTIYLLIHSQ